MLDKCVGSENNMLQRGKSQLDTQLIFYISTFLLTPKSFLVLHFKIIIIIVYLIKVELVVCDKSLCTRLVHPRFATVLRENLYGCIFAHTVHNVIFLT